MSDLLSTFRRRAQELIDAINGSGGLRATVDGLRRQMAESDRRRTIQKARSDLRSMDRQIDEMITAVGVQAVGLHRAGRLTAPELAPLAAHVIELQSAVEQQRQALTALEAAAAQERPEGRHCAQCGHELPAQATFCPTCGAAAPGAEQAGFCSACGTALRAGAKFCPRCGQGVLR
ncbi:MAG: zinc ribbon domain-containing protein [Anaerolineae bacterium]